MNGKWIELGNGKERTPGWLKEQSLAFSHSKPPHDQSSFSAPKDFTSIINDLFYIVKRILAIRIYQDRSTLVFQ